MILSREEEAVFSVPEAKFASSVRALANAHERCKTDPTALAACIDHVHQLCKIAEIYPGVEAMYLSTYVPENAFPAPLRVARELAHIFKETGTLTIGNISSTRDQLSLLLSNGTED